MGIPGAITTGGSPLVGQQHQQKPVGCPRRRGRCWVCAKRHKQSHTGVGNKLGQTCGKEAGTVIAFVITSASS